MRIEHVDLGAHPNLLSQYRGIQRALIGYYGGFQRAHLRDVAGDPQITLPCGEFCAAARVFEILPRLVFVGQRFAHARIDDAALVQRDGQLKADDFGGGIGS